MALLAPQPSYFCGSALVERGFGRRWVSAAAADAARSPAAAQIQDATDRGEPWHCRQRQRRLRRGRPPPSIHGR
nr:unnamed protein product [Digitaria exilis]